MNSRLAPRRLLLLSGFAVVLALGAAAAGFLIGRSAAGEDGRLGAVRRAEDERLSADEILDSFEDVSGLRVEAITYDRAFDETVFDFDGDDDLDLLLQIHNTGDDPLWTRGEEGFSPSGVALPVDAPEDWAVIADRHSCDAADVDGDGDADLYCSRGATSGTGLKRNEVWLQEDGGFTELIGHGAEDPTGRGRAVRFLELNGDGIPDLFVTNHDGRRDDDLPNHNRLYVGAGDGTFTESTQDSPILGPIGSACTPAVADWNGDGLDDLALCAADKAFTGLYENFEGSLRPANGLLGGSAATPDDAAGTEAAAPTRTWRDVRLHDLDEDGDADLLILTARRLEIRLNDESRPDRRFAKVAFKLRFEENPVALGLADMNDDGELDVYVAQQGMDCTSGEGPNGRDLILFGPDFGTSGPAPYTPDGCATMARAVGPHSVLVVNGQGGKAGPIIVVSTER